MRAVVLSIGAELLRGDITDRNATFLTRQLSQLGFDVLRVEQRGDDLVDLTSAFEAAMADADLVVCTGGLGPTADDLSRQAIAGALGEQLFVDKALLQGIKDRFAAMGRRMPDSNNQQAFLIPSASTLPNPRGTAPGWLVNRDGRTIVAMPGPPSEMEPMWREQVQPRLEEQIPGATAMRALMTFGLGESAVEERIRSVIEWRPEVTVATYAKSAGVEVHITARAEATGKAARLVDEAEMAVRERLGDAVFGSGEDTLAAAAARVLMDMGLSLAVLESATGGALSALITDHPGSSEYFRGGVVAYTRAAKAQHGVPTDVMDAHGLISEETALAMAGAARLHFGADVGLATTGVAGSGRVEGKDPGTVFIALCTERLNDVRVVRRPGDRATIKHFAAQSALDLLRRRLREAENTVP